MFAISLMGIFNQRHGRKRKRSANNLKPDGPSSHTRARAHTHLCDMIITLTLTRERESETEKREEVWCPA